MKRMLGKRVKVFLTLNEVYFDFRITKVIYLV